MSDRVDAVAALKMLEDIIESINEFRKSTPGMIVVEGMHPIDECIPYLEGARFALLAKYGKMMWDTADGPIDKPHSQDNIHDVSS